MTASDIKQAVASVLALARPVDLSTIGKFASNLIFLYHTTVASENLLKTAISYSEGALLQFFVDHLKEETGHHTWLARDLASIGIEIENTIVPRHAVELVGSQYYLIQHLSPAALLGYMVLMECFPMPLDQVQLLEAIHGTDALRTSKYHAVHDQDHGEDILSVIDSLSEQERSIVLQSAIQSAHYFIAVIDAFR